MRDFLNQLTYQHIINQNHDYKINKPLILGVAYFYSKPHLSIFFQDRPGAASPCLFHTKEVLPSTAQHMSFSLALTAVTVSKPQSRFDSAVIVELADKAKERCTSVPSSS